MHTVLYDALPYVIGAMGPKPGGKKETMMLRASQVVPNIATMSFRYLPVYQRRSFVHRYPGQSFCCYQFNPSTAFLLTFISKQCLGSQRWISLHSDRRIHCNGVQTLIHLCVLQNGHTRWGWFNNLDSGPTWNEHFTATNAQNLYLCTGVWLSDIASEYGTNVPGVRL